MKFFHPEGATPLDDISGLKPAWVKTQEDLNDVEAENISNATSKYLLKSVNPPQQWFNVPFLQKIHFDMFCDVWEWAGKFRTTQTCPGIKSFQIRVALANLCEDVYYWCETDCTMSVIEQASKIHHQLVYIHPYPNGNGRFSRLVSDMYLKARKFPFPNWPIDLDRNGQSRAQYIAALKKADLGDYEPLIAYMVELSVPRAPTKIPSVK